MVSSKHNKLFKIDIRQNMITRGSQQFDPQSVDLPIRFPIDSEIQHIEYVPKGTDAAKAVFEFSAPLSIKAILASDSISATNDSTANLPTIQRLTLLLIPAVAGSLADGDLLARIEHWVTGTDGLSQRNSSSGIAPVLMMTLQGAKVLWRNGRAAVLAQADRLDTLKLAVIESAFYELEVSQLERLIGENWPQLEADVPQAFAVDDTTFQTRKELSLRYRQSMAWRSRLARVGPAVHSPHVYPATLASQMSERFRERTRLTHRHEFLQDQMEIFERVYESCAQRSSDYVLARKGHILEWIIIILLLTQILFYVFEILSSATPPTTDSTETSVQVESV